MKTLIYQNNISASFRASVIDKVYEIADRLGFNPKWISALMMHESGWNIAAVNPDGGASGLFQVMPATAKSLGTTVEAIRKMGYFEQLELLYKYMQPYKGLPKDYIDFALINFYPNAGGKFAATLEKPDSWIFPSEVVRQNRAFDINRDGILTKGEYRKYLSARYTPEQWAILKKKSVDE